MQCTLSPIPSASAAWPEEYAVAPASLAAAFALVPDPRRQASVRYPLPALLTAALAAILCNHRSVLAMAQWIARQSPAVLQHLGFPAAYTPCQSTMPRLFAKRDGQALTAALSAHFAPATTPADAPMPQGVASDGKAQRGRLRFATRGCPVHALTAFCHESGIVLAHEPIEPATAPGEKHEAELTVAPAILARIAWHGRVLTGDALFCQRNLCQQVLAAQGDYLLLVKDTQETLYEDIRLLFDPPGSSAPLPLLDQREAHTSERGHGRQDDRRHLTASTDLTGYLDWPGLAQVFRVEHTWRVRGQTKCEVQYGLTSLSPAVGSPECLLALKRGHWAIENQLHWVKDVTLGEDASLVHCGQGPTVLALLREAAISVLRRAGIRQIAARLREHSQYPSLAGALLLDPLHPHA
jgi:predicted transposase YbfD/YdcC